MLNRIRLLILGCFMTVLPWTAAATPVDVDGDGIVGPQEVIDLSMNWKGPALPQGGLQPWQIDGATIFYNTGNVGIGTATPVHRLRISGGPDWTTNLWAGSVELDNGAAIGWRGNAGGQHFGIGQTHGGLSFFRTDSDPGTAASEAQNAMTITDAGTVHIPGSVGIGGDIASQGARFQVNDGRIRIRETATLERWDLFYDPPSEKFYLQENAAYNHLVFTKGPDERVGMGTLDPAAKLHVLRSAGTAVLGESPNGNGVVGSSSAAGFGATAGTHSGTNGIGVYGQANLGSSAMGVWGTSESGLGALGSSNINVGVKGTSNSNIGVQGVSASSSGVEGRSDSSEGVYGYSANRIGVYGSTGGNDVDDAGVVAQAGGSNSAALRVEGNARFNGSASFSSNVSIDGAALFGSNVSIAGELFVAGPIINKSAGSVRIDHPLDPANKYLSHSSIESPDMMNIYNGNVITDATGYAEIMLPDYFEALNSDFRYQLTIIDDANSDDFVQAKVVKRIKANQFSIRTSRATVEVSWQVTGIRQDPYAKANPMEVEKVKPEKDRGKYLTPEVFGQPKEMGIHYQPRTAASTQAADQASSLGGSPE